MSSHVGFPALRLRRLRQTLALRRLVAETRLSAAQLVLPLFVRPGRRIRREVAVMPGVFQLSPDELLSEAARAHQPAFPRCCSSESRRKRTPGQWRLRA
jgi:porphobilinogen synthase